MASPTICFRIPCRPSRLPTDCRCPVQATWPGQPARRMLSVLTAQYDESVYGIFDRDVCYAESKCAQYENSLGQRVSSPSARPVRSGAITIAYSTGWSEAYIHYQRGDGCAFHNLKSTMLVCQVQVIIQQKYVLCMSSTRGRNVSLLLQPVQPVPPSAPRSQQRSTD